MPFRDLSTVDENSFIVDVYGSATVGDLYRFVQAKIEQSAEDT